MKIYEVVEPTKKAAVVATILADLPAWFGLPESTAAYVASAKELVCFVAEAEGEVLGFVTVAQPFAKVAEINAMGVLAPAHRQGIGQSLMAAVLNWGRQAGIEYLQVKTLADTHPDPNYAKTRRFYQSQGFVPLEIFPTLWGAENPCLQMIRGIKLN